MKRTLSGLTILFLLLGAGCGARYRDVQLPPKIDLTQHEIIGVVEFESNREGQLGPLATQRFVDLARRDQGLVRMLDLEAAPDARDPSAIAQRGRERGVQTLFVGRVDVSDIRPNLSIAGSLRSGRLTATVDASLTVDLIEAASGASLWSSSARTTATVGQISVFGDKSFNFDAEDPEAAYGNMIDRLVSEVTWDFRSTWIQERIEEN